MVAQAGSARRFGALAFRIGLTARQVLPLSLVASQLPCCRRRARRKRIAGIKNLVRVNVLWVPVKQAVAASLPIQRSSQLAARLHPPLLSTPCPYLLHCTICLTLCRMCTRLRCTWTRQRRTASWAASSGGRLQRRWPRTSGCLMVRAATEC